jgi:multidrug resistance efflux pump
VSGQITEVRVARQPVRSDRATLYVIDPLISRLRSRRAKRQLRQKGADLQVKRIQAEAPHASQILATTPEE